MNSVLMFLLKSNQIQCDWSEWVVCAELRLNSEFRLQSGVQSCLSEQGLGHTSANTPAVSSRDPAALTACLRQDWTRSLSSFSLGESDHLIVSDPSAPLIHS